MQSERQLRSKYSVLTRCVRVGWVGFCLLFIAACHMDMYNQPRYQPYEESTFFRDGASSRPLEPGTVSRAPAEAGPQSPVSAQSMTIASGRAGNDFVATNPLPVNEELLARGEDRFKIFCAPCHGLLANGRSGITYRYYNPPPPSFYIDRLKNAPDGYIYDVITNGYGQMFSYASRIPVEDRWAIIAYIRQLEQNPPEELKPEDFVETTPTPESQGGEEQQATPAPTPSS